MEHLHIKQPKINKKFFEIVQCEFLKFTIIMYTTLDWHNFTTKSRKSQKMEMHIDFLALGTKWHRDKICSAKLNSSYKYK